VLNVEQRKIIEIRSSQNETLIMVHE